MSAPVHSPRPEHPVPLHGGGALYPFETAPLPPGTRIGADVVEGVLGSGGFAIVYRVRSPEGRLSALKLLPLDEGPERTERAWRELSLGTRLHHPNLGRQVGAGQWPEDKPRFLWLKLELIEGPTLDEWGLAAGRTVGEVVDRMLEVARGLAVMHEARVVHRDVKEANILVRQGTGQAVLVDFGVGYHEGDATLTKGMFPPGTPPYRAPEAWAYGRAHAGEPGAHYRAGPGDDLYAMGVVLYRLLTGRFPFRPAEHGGEDVEAVLHQTPLPPHLVNPSVPRAVEAVCLRLLAKTPEARYPGAVALYEALEELRARTDVVWTAPLHPERRPAVKPRARVGRVLAAVGVGLAVTLGAWWLTPGQEVAPGEDAPEPGWAVTAPLAPRKDSAPVKQPQQTTPGPQPETAPKRRGAAVRKACLGLTGAALQACLGAPQQVPPDRPAPPPQACPAGAVETMTGTLGFRLKEKKIVQWSDVRGRSVRVDEDTPMYVVGHWNAGANRFGYGGRFALPDNTRLSGRLYVKEGRVYGRLTEARTPLGVTYPVCLELLDTDYKVGLELQPGSAPGKMMVDPVAVVRVVDRFE
ncbi:serine/threonine-protein kinase [Archangium gephyra]|uniref:Serine/threonine-protein kinase n=1 Tax=Archangium gephyra TaxID=48 RepID=A0AAC8TES2_9BACT|nr:serine/threonine protein kinase [Archangium gephyra]AKJ01831.1 serine/threonine protein kinase [Archangium gephyra]REG34640.1 serine/threonine-protein kinase [Archangium gephyra]